KTSPTPSPSNACSGPSASSGSSTTSRATTSSAGRKEGVGGLRRFFCRGKRSSHAARVVQFPCGIHSQQTTGLVCSLPWRPLMKRAVSAVAAVLALATLAGDARAHHPCLRYAGMPVYGGGGFSMGYSYGVPAMGYGYSLGVPAYGYGF